MSDYRGLMIGETAPHFTANTTYGQINFPEDYKGKWVVFFSHPGDFTPVCTTEIMTFANMSEEFKANGCELLGLSIDSNPSHIDWCRAMERYSWKGIKNPKISFPIVADDFGNIARLYGMLMPTASATRTVRNVFIIDPKGIIRAILVYPLSTGRNMKEIMRLLLALQAYDNTGYATPADWMPGEPQIIPVPQTMTAAEERLDEGEKGAYSCLDWYICFTKGSQDGNMPNSAQTTPLQTSKVDVGRLAKAAAAITDNNVGIPEIMKILGADPLIEHDSSMRILNAAEPQTTSAGKIAYENGIKDAGGAAGKGSVNTPPKRPVHDVKSIMEQNQLLFNSDENFGFGNEFMITRDYPNNGK